MTTATSTATPPDPKDVRWDAGDYHRHSSAQTGWGREVHDRLSLRGDEHAVDLGCGDGRLTSELGTRVPRGWVTGLDADAQMIRFAERQYGGKNVSFVEADVRRFSLERSVDLFVSTACLHWVADHEQVLRRCRAPDSVCSAASSSQNRRSTTGLTGSARGCAHLDASHLTGA